MQGLNPRSLQIQTHQKAMNHFLENKSNYDNKKKDYMVSVRMSNETKFFYQCLANADNKSVQSTLFTTLELVKKSYSEEYDFRNKIDYFYQNQANTIFKMMDENNIDYNEIDLIFSFIAKREIKRSDLSDLNRIINLFSKSFLQEITSFFGYNYDWLIDKTTSKYIKHNNSFLSNFSDDVKYVNLVFASSKNDLVINLNSESKSQSVSDFVSFYEVNRDVNGVKFKTYHFNGFFNSTSPLEQLNFKDLVLSLCDSSSITGYFLSEETIQKIFDSELHIVDAIKNIDGFNYKKNDFKTGW